MTISDEFDSEEMKEIDKRLKEYKPYYNMYLRYLVIKMVMEGYTRGEAAEHANVHRKTAENWVKLYNKNGIDGLEPNYSNCGLNCRLSDDQLEELKDIILKSKNNYTIHKVKKLIKDKFDVDYTYKQTWVIVKDKLGIKLT